MKFKIFIKHRKQDESQNVTNINFECSAMSSFNRYKKNLRDSYLRFCKMFELRKFSAVMGIIFIYSGLVFANSK